MTTVSPVLNNRRPSNPALTPKRFILRRLLDSWRSVFDAALPMGYEDETGFHYGAEPAANRAEQKPKLPG
jgi:hypothetical protein